MIHLRTITEYIWVAIGDEYGFREVSDTLALGYQPWGSPIIHKDTVFQAFVKYKGKKNDHKPQIIPPEHAHGGVQG